MSPIGGCSGDFLDPRFGMGISISHHGLIVAQKHMAVSTLFTLQNVEVGSPGVSLNPPASKGTECPPPANPPTGDKIPLTPIARMVRAAREHAAIIARNMVSNHEDMEDKYFGHCDDNRRRC